MTAKRRTGIALAGSAVLLAVLPVVSGPVSATGLTAVVNVSTPGVPTGELDVAANALGKTAAVWLEGNPVGGTHVMLSTRAPGKTSWTAPALVAATQGVGPEPVVVVAPGGEVVVVFRSESGLWSRVQSSSGTLGSPTVISTQSGLDNADLAIGPDGKATAVWTVPLDDDGHEVHASSRPANGTWGGTQLLADNIHSGLRLNPGPAGQLAVSWVSRAGGFTEYDAVTRVRPGGSSVFGPPENIGPGSYLGATSPQILFAENGITRAIFTRDIGSGMRVVRSLRNNGTGIWSTPLSESAVFSDEPSAAIDPDGVLYAVWQERLNPESVGLRTLRFVEGLSSVTTLLPGSEQPSGSPGTITLNRNGSPVIAWGHHPGTEIDGKVEYFFYSVRSDNTAAGTWGAKKTSSLGASDGTPPTWTPAGNGELSLTGLDSKNLTDHDQVRSRILDTRGPVTALTAPKDRTRITTSAVPLAWTLSDLSPSTTSVLVSGAPFNGSFGSRVTWKSGLTGTKASFSASPGRTYCFVVRGKDTHDNTGSISNQRCIVTPVDDRSLTASSGWTKRTGTGFYRSTFRETTKLGAALSLSKVIGKSFALLASTGPGQGSVAIYLGTTKIKTISLTSTTHKRMAIIPIKTYTSLKTAKLTIKVVSANKRVRIDGVYVGR